MGPRNGCAAAAPDQRIERAEAPTPGELRLVLALVALIVTDSVLLLGIDYAW